MSGVALPKWKSYTLPSVESFHIMRSPPSSIHTRKKERVDFSDVSYMVRNDDSRINEGISYLSRGINPMVDISYNNMGGGGSRTNTMASIQSGNPYKAFKDGAFRPPEYKQEDLLPLSRQKHPETAAITNPGLSGYNIHNLESQIDNAEVSSAIDKQKINYIEARPTAVYRMEIPVEVFSGHRLRDQLKVSASAGFIGDKNYDISRYSSTNNPLQAGKNVLDISATPNMNNPNNNINRDDSIDITNYIKDNIILKNISPNFRILMYDTNNKNYSEVFSSIKDKINIAVQSSLNNPIDVSRSDGHVVKLKDYRWKVVHSAVGGDNLVIIPNNTPELELERNMPLYSAGTNVSGYTNNKRLDTNDPLTDNKIQTSAGTNISGYTKIERIHTSDPITDIKIQTSVGSGVSMNYGRRDAIHDKERLINLRGMGSVGGISNMGNIPMERNHDIPTLTSKNMNVKQSAAREMGGRYETY